MQRHVRNLAIAALFSIGFLGFQAHSAFGQDEFVPEAPITSSAFKASWSAPGSDGSNPASVDPTSVDPSQLRAPAPTSVRQTQYVPPAPVYAPGNDMPQSSTPPQAPSYQDQQSAAPEGSPTIFGIPLLSSQPLGPPAGMGSPQPANAPPSDMPSPKFGIPLTATWGTSQGFQLQTEGGDFTFQFHNLTQIDYRGYSHSANVPNGTAADRPGGGASGPNDTFTAPRVWWIFNGNLTKNWEWMIAPSFQVDNVNLLDAWINAHYDDRLQVKVGRYKTPFTYEFYAEPIQGLINPERSLFFNNFGLNREFGAMAHGTVLNKYADYAIGAFNGQRNSYNANLDSEDIVGYVNFRPFMCSDMDYLQRVDIGGSFDVGQENNPANAGGTGGTPSVFRTNVATNGNMVNGVEFLQLKSTVFEQGARALGDLHLAYYYKQLSLITELQFGIDSYQNTGVVPAGGAAHARVPIGSWYVQGGYFLTGESTVYRNTVKPLHPFSASGGGYGAWELTGRFDTLKINDRLFSDKMVDTTGGNVWTNQVDLTDLGVNWYPNQWLKIAMLWEHAAFGNPVTMKPGQTFSTNDMVWTRLQLWF